MKIGIIAINMFTHGLNFACPLHTYAFQKYLNKLGVDNTVITYRPNYDDDFNQEHPSDSFKNKIEMWKEKLIEAKKKNDEIEIEKCTNKIALLNEKYNAYVNIYEEREKRYKKFWNFINSQYRRTEEIYNSGLLEVLDAGFDCYFAVTDVIWGKTPFGYDPGFFLASSSMDNKWKISYSASMLVTENEQDEKLTRDWIKDQDFVSVRECDLQKRVLKDIRTDVAWVVDPVLLHDEIFWNEISQKPCENDYLFLYYVVDRNPYIIIKAIEYAKKYGLRIIVTADQPLMSEHLLKNSGLWEFKYDIGVEEWLGYIQNSRVVFTNSFHCCCFSTIFKKDFFAQKRKYDKVSMFLNSVGLGNRIIDEKAEFDTMNLPETDWDSVQFKLNRRIENSKSFIMNALNVVNQSTSHPCRDNEDRKRKQTFKVWYNIGKQITTIEGHSVDETKRPMGSYVVRAKSIEFSETDAIVSNNETSYFSGNVFVVDKATFVGWRLRAVIGTQRILIYLMENGMWVLQSEYKKNKNKVKVFQPNDTIPYIPFNCIRSIVAEAIWQE